MERKGELLNVPQTWVGDRLNHAAMLDLGIREDLTKVLYGGGRHPFRL